MYNEIYDDEEQKHIFGQNLKRLSLASGKRQVEIAEDLGVSHQLFSKWINGKNIPRMGKIEAIAKYFGVSKSDLVDKQDFSKVTQKAADLYKPKDFGYQTSNGMNFETDRTSGLSAPVLRAYIDAFNKALAINLPEEVEVIEAYRKAPDYIKRTICDVLGVKRSEER